MAKLFLSLIFLICAFFIVLKVEYGWTGLSFYILLCVLVVFLNWINLGKNGKL